MCIRNSPYSFESEGKTADLKVNVNHNLKYLRVEIRTSGQWTDNTDAITSGLTIADNIRVNTLRIEENFIPRGSYVFSWDGWWATADQGGSEGGGRLIPGGTDSADTIKVKGWVIGQRRFSDQFAFDHSSEIAIVYTSPVSPLVRQSFSVTGGVSEISTDTYNEYYLNIMGAIPYRIAGNYYLQYEIGGQTFTHLPPFDSTDMLTVVDGDGVDISDRVDVWIIYDLVSRQPFMTGSVGFTLRIDRPAIFDLNACFVSYHGTWDGTKVLPDYPIEEWHIGAGAAINLAHDKNVKMPDSVPHMFVFNPRIEMRKRSWTLFGMIEKPVEERTWGTSRWLRYIEKGSEVIGFIMGRSRPEPLPGVPIAAWMLFIDGAGFQLSSVAGSGEKRFQVVDSRGFAFRAVNDTSMTGGIERGIIIYWVPGEYSSPNYHIKEAMGRLRNIPFLELTI